MNWFKSRQAEASPEVLDAEPIPADLKWKLRQYFAGKIVRKDLTKKIKEGANVPV